MIRRGYKKCGPCTKKGMTCGGNFSQATFDRLESKKQELRQQAKQGRKLMVTFARQLLLQEERVAAMEAKLERLTRRQDALLDHEARALGEMDEMAGDSSIAEQQVFDFRDPLLLQDDPANLDMPDDLPSPGPEGDPGCPPFDWNAVSVDQQFDWSEILNVEGSRKPAGS